MRHSHRAAGRQPKPQVQSKHSLQGGGGGGGDDGRDSRGSCLTTRHVNQLGVFGVWDELHHLFVYTINQLTVRRVAIMSLRHSLIIVIRSNYECCILRHWPNLYFYSNTVLSGAPSRCVFHLSDLNKCEREKGYYLRSLNASYSLKQCWKFVLSFKKRRDMALCKQGIITEFLLPLNSKYFQIKTGSRVTSGWNDTSSQVHKRSCLKWSKKED